MTTDTKVMDRISESLHRINSLRDFVAALEVGSKVAGEMLAAMETRLLDCMDEIGDAP